MKLLNLCSLQGDLHSAQYKSVPVSGKKYKVIVIENDGKIREMIKAKQNPQNLGGYLKATQVNSLPLCWEPLVQKAGQESGINLRKNRFTAELCLKAQKNIRPQTSNKHSSFIFQYKCNC